MATRVHESGVVDGSVDKVWDLLRPLDFSFLSAVATSVVEGRQNPARVGSVRRVIYRDGTLQRIKLMELNDASHTVTYDVITSEPPVPYTSAIHTIRLRRVTFGGKTLVELTSDFSSDASLPVIADAKWKRLEILNGLREAVASRKQAPTSLEDFRKRAALADSLISSLSERLSALERARRTGKESKGGQIFATVTGETSDPRFQENSATWAAQSKKLFPGLILHSGATMVDSKRFTTFLAFDSNASLIDYITSDAFKTRQSQIKEVTSNVNFSVYGAVSKAAKEVLVSRGYNPFYYEFNGFIRS